MWQNSSLQQCSRKNLSDSAQQMKRGALPQVWYDRYVITCVTTIEGETP